MEKMISVLDDGPTPLVREITLRRRQSTNWKLETRKSRPEADSGLRSSGLRFVMSCFFRGLGGLGVLRAINRSFRAAWWGLQVPYSHLRMAFALTFAKVAKTS
jgi:hypothetical protein